MYAFDKEINYWYVKISSPSRQLSALEEEEARIFRNEPLPAVVQEAVFSDPCSPFKIGRIVPAPAKLFCYFLGISDGIPYL